MTLDTRRILSMGLDEALYAPTRETKSGVFRM